MPWLPGLFSPIQASVGRITRRKPTSRYQRAFKSEGLIALLLRPIFEGDDQVELGVPWQMRDGTSPSADHTYHVGPHANIQFTPVRTWAGSTVAGALKLVLRKRACIDQ